MTVAIHGIADSATVEAISAMAACWDLRVEARGDGDFADAAGVILGGSRWKEQLEAVAAERPCLAFAGGGAPDASATARQVKFAGHAAIPEILHGKVLVTSEATQCGALDDVADMACGASIAGRAVWRVFGGGKPGSLAVATPPPRLESGQRVAQILNGETFLHALPVWLFLQRLADSRWRRPLARACLVVDDPNLHRPAYGHISYAGLVGLARDHRCHTAIATVPLDGWWISDAAARVFRENPDALSLLIHGNNHLPFELAQPRSKEQRSFLAAQSLDRAAAFEKRARLRLDRVMAPPHGVCSRAMMDALRRGGFEGMTTNRWSLWKHSPPETLPEDFGVRPADVLEGLPVVSRFRFNSMICRNEICMAALLGQPIVPYGHHQDFSRDMVEARKAVEEVNALGQVQWMSMERILETNFEQYADEGDLLRIRLFSVRVRGTMPEGKTRLQVELPPSGKGWEPEVIVKRLDQAECRGVVTKAGESISLPAGCHFEARLAAPALPSASGAEFTYRANALLRRLVSEMRDRARL